MNTEINFDPREGIDNGFLKVEGAKKPVVLQVEERIRDEKTRVETKFNSLIEALDKIIAGDSTESLEETVQNKIDHFKYQANDMHQAALNNYRNGSDEIGDSYKRLTEIYNAELTFYEEVQDDIKSNNFQELKTRLADEKDQKLEAEQFDARLEKIQEIKEKDKDKLAKWETK